MNLVMDIGGTNVRLGLVAADGQLSASTTYSWEEAGTLTRAIERFCAHKNLKPPFAKLVVAFAGPIVPGQSLFAFTNASQTFSRAELEGFASQILIVNDFVAQAALVHTLGGEDTFVLKAGQVNPSAAKAVLGPGTGLGVCAIAAEGTIIPGEGGNTVLPFLPHQSALIHGLQTLEPRPYTWRIEDVLSGPGIERIYAVFGGQGSPTAEAISKAAKAGEPTAQRAFTCYFDYLAITCANQALQYSAAGGIYIVGNISNTNLELLDHTRFENIFTSIQSHKGFLRNVPVKLVTKPTSGLKGAAVLMRGF